MASAAITLDRKPAQIESDSTEAQIFKAKPGLTGVLFNASTVTTYLLVSLNPLVTSTGVATSGAQQQLAVTLPANGIFPVLDIYLTISHKTAATSTILDWFPD